MNPRMIKSIIRQWKYEAGVDSPIMFKYDSSGEITIYTSQPGFLVGKAGTIINKFKLIFQNELRGFTGIKLQEVFREYV